MVKVEGAKRAFTKFYAKLTEVLPVNDLLADLYANRLLPGNHKAMVESQGEFPNKHNMMT